MDAVQRAAPSPQVSDWHELYDRPGRWLELELRRERNSFGDKLFSRLADFSQGPEGNRRTIREGFGAALRELGKQAVPTVAGSVVSPHDAIIVLVLIVEPSPSVR